MTPDATRAWQRDPLSLTVSVVLAAYNGERFIERQLLSLLNQTHPPKEIIVADDRSEDSTMAIVEAIASTADIPVRIIINERNLGFSENFLSATERATGDLVAFCDQDDVWHANKLEVCVNAFDQNTVLVVHAARLIDENEQPIGSFAQGIVENRMRGPLQHDPFGVFFGFTMVFRRSLLDVIPSTLRPRDYVTGKAQLAHDRWVLYLANMMGATKEIAQPLVGYRQHPENLFGASNQFSVRRSIHDAIPRTERYISSAADQLQLIDRIDATAASRFPLFDRPAAKIFWRQALRQQIARAHVYAAQGRIGGMGILLKNLATGAYASVHSGRIQLKSIVKDLTYILFAPRPQIEPR